jgi:hypothetical protein
LLTAYEIGAHAVGCDINPKCELVLKQNKIYFPGAQKNIPIIIGPIIDEYTIESINSASFQENG